MRPWVESDESAPEDALILADWERAAEELEQAYDAAARVALNLPPYEVLVGRYQAIRTVTVDLVTCVLACGQAERSQFDRLRSLYTKADLGTVESPEAAAGPLAGDRNWLPTARHAGRLLASRRAICGG